MIGVRDKENALAKRKEKLQQEHFPLILFHYHILSLVNTVMTNNR